MEGGRGKDGRLGGRWRVGGVRMGGQERGGGWEVVRDW